MPDKKRKFNIVDFVLLAVILLFAVSIVAKIIYPDFFRTKPRTVTVSCTFTTDSDMSPYAAALKDGDKIYINTDVLLGTITKTDSKEALSDEDGEASDKTEYTITAICDLSFESGAYRAKDGTAITTGSVLEVNTKDTFCILSVENTIEAKN